jgi:hypothetical protein
MAHVFISYDAEDRELAREIVTGLEAAGWSVWWDRRIPAGKTWRSVLDKALEDMDCMLVLWSARSIESHWVIEEAEEGRSRGKLLPLLMEPVRPPRGFREIQALSFVDWDRSAEAACFRTLLHDLAALTGEPAPAAPGPRATLAPPARGARDAAPACTAARPSAQATAPIGEPAAAVGAGAPAFGADRDARAGTRVAAAWGTRKLAVTISIAALALLALVAFIDRDSDSEVAAPMRNAAEPSREQTQAAEGVTPPAVQRPSGTSLVEPSSTPLVNPSGSLLGPAPTRERGERPSAIAPLVQGIAPGGGRSTPEMDRFEQQREERRRQRQAEIERKLSDMKGSPAEIERARIRLELDAANQDQAEMTQALDEMNRQALESIRSIKP